MTYPPIDLSSFPQRESSLQNIIRYHRFTTMFYRTNLLVHSERLLWLVEDILPLIKQLDDSFDEEAARSMALIHDDHEIVMGDVMFGEKLLMDTAQTVHLQQQEQEAMERIAQQFPPIILHYSYKELLVRYNTLKPHTQDKEATLIKYIDKLDGLCEAMHELFAGNESFLHGYSRETGDPVGTYMEFFHHTMPLYRSMREIHVPDHPFFSIPKSIDTQQIAKHGLPHHIESVHAPTPYPFYTRWKEITIERGGQHGIELLTLKRE